MNVFSDAELSLLRNGWRLQPAHFLVRVTVTLSLIGLAALLSPVARTQVDRSPPPILWILLDTSASMWARDVPGDRLSQAISYAGECVDAWPGEVGIRTVAGSMRTVCPPTGDRSFAHSVLSSLKNESQPLGGSRLTVAVEQIIREYASDSEDATPTRQLVILFTDGDDDSPHEESNRSLPKMSKLILVGVGDAETESNVPLPAIRPLAPVRFLEVDGTPATTRLRVDQLEQLARRFHARVILPRLETNELLRAVTEGWMNLTRDQELQESMKAAAFCRQWLLFLAALSASFPLVRFRASRALTLCACCLLGGCSKSAVKGKSPIEAYEAGRSYFREGDYLAAARSFQASRDPDRSVNAWSLFAEATALIKYSIDHPEEWRRYRASACQLLRQAASAVKEDHREMARVLSSDIMHQLELAKQLPVRSESDEGSARRDGTTPSPEPVTDAEDQAEAERIRPLATDGVKPRESERKSSVDQGVVRQMNDALTWKSTESMTLSEAEKFIARDVERIRSDASRHRTMTHQFRHQSIDESDL